MVTDAARVQRLLELVPSFPTATWDGTSWAPATCGTPNSLIAWLLAGSGHDAGALHPPAGGRAPGWDAGLAVPLRLQSEATLERRWHMTV